MTQPVSTLYGGAHLFREGTPEKLARLARSFAEAEVGTDERYAAVFGLAPALASEVRTRVAGRLAARAVDDLRVDFEDGYGVRGDDAEDADADAVADALAREDAAGRLPRRVGVRVKAFSGDTEARAERTLVRVVSRLPKLPEGFVVTLPKPASPGEVSRLASVLSSVEAARSLPRIPVELMVEEPRALYGVDGRLALPSLVEAGRGRVTGLHLGTYDLTASLGVVASHQTTDHPLADHARALMLFAFAGSGVELSDGATTELPIAPHKGAELGDRERVENRAAVDRALRVHFDAVTRSLRMGLYQGWDLHPAQLVARYAAVVAFFLGARPAMERRLLAFLDRAAQATRVGTAFDDAATGRGLVAFFVRGLDAGAFDEGDLASLGVPLAALRAGDLVALSETRRRPVW